MRSRSSRLMPLVAAVFVAAGLGGLSVSTSGSASTTSVDGAELPVELEPTSTLGTSEPPSEGASTESVSDANGLAGAWVDVTVEAIGETAEWTNKVELADINADGLVDVLFANGGDYETAGTPVLSRVFVNRGDGSFDEATETVFGDVPLLTRVIKVGDLNGDGHADIVVGTTFDTQSRLLLGAGGGSFSDVTSTSLPVADLSVGDLELGDVDADGDLDIALADWGDGSPFGVGGVVALWLNDGTGIFADATAAQMPATLVGFSWDLELVDVDNDWDLDIAVSCKNCPTSLMYVNDGTGTFSDDTANRMPAFSNNYEFAPIDLDGDGFLDLVTINDGVQRAGLAEHVFRNDGTGAFIDVTDEWWPAEANPGWDDNVVVALDVESDGDADFLIGSLDGPDRLLVNDGTGALTMHDDVFDANPSGGTLGLAVADLNGDGRLDIVESQGEVPGHEDERVYLATELLPADTAPPIIRFEIVGSSIIARIHDNRTPNMPHDWQLVTAAWTGGEAPMTWYGENLFRASIPADVEGLEVCAVDAAGNQTCTN